MKIVRTGALLMALFLATSGHARDLKTFNGEVFKNITINKVDATGINITHDDGVTFIDFRNLAEAEQKEFGYDPAAYAVAWKLKLDEDKVRREQALAAQQARAKALAAATPAPTRDFAPRTVAPNNQTTIEVTVDSPGFQYGFSDYTGRGFSNVIPPTRGGTVVPYPTNAYGPYPYYNGATWGPTIIRRR